MNEELKEEREKVLRWSVHPVRENWRVSFLLVVFLLSLWIGIYFIFREVLWVILAILFLGVSLFPFFIVTNYQMDEKKVTIKRLMMNWSRDWSNIRSFYPDRHGVLLSPFSKPSRLENFRGLYLRFGKNREEVLEFIKKRIQKNLSE